MKDYNELKAIQEKIREEVNSDAFIQTLCRMNCTGTLDEFMTMLEPYKPVNDCAFHPSPNGKILVVGGSRCKRNELSAIGRNMGIPKERFVFVLDFVETKKYPFWKLRCNEDWAAVMLGPIPHKIQDMESVIATMEHDEKYPPIVRLGSNDLKITKTNFKECLRSLIDTNIVSTSA